MKLTACFQKRLRRHTRVGLPSSHSVRMSATERLESRCVLSANMCSADEALVAPTHAADTRSVSDELLLQFDANASDHQLQSLYATYGLTEKERLYGDQNVRRVAVPEGAIESVRTALLAESLVEHVEPNYVINTTWTPQDPFYAPYQWHLTNSIYGGIHVEEAWDTATGEGVVVAVLDTGVAYENYTDASGSYYVAPDLAQTRFVAGYDFINHDAHPNDDNGHGTHVAGTIAQSTNNGRGVSGVAFNASIMPVKVLDRDGYGSYSAIASGIRWAADHGAHVINMSLGADVPSPILEDALAYAFQKGVTIVAAAGNDGVSSVSYPAAYDHYVIAVSATRYDEQLARYSNYGTSIDLAAPGGDTTIDQNGDGYADGVLQQTFDPSSRDTSAFGYYFFQGTSMAAPHVAGVAALIVSLGVTDPREVRHVLESSAEDKGAIGRDQYYGHGIVNAAAAVARAQALTTPSSDPQPPGSEPGTDNAGEGEADETGDESPTPVNRDRASVFSLASDGSWWAADVEGGEAVQVAQWSSTVRWQDPIARDFNGDGYTDLAARTGNGVWWVGVANQDGFTTTRWGTWGATHAWRDVLPGDFNGDGRTDVAGRADNGAWIVSVSNGVDGFDTSPWTRWSTTVEWSHIMIGDFNNDHRDDLIGQTSNGSWWVAESVGSGFQNRRLGQWSSQVEWLDVTIADFNGDGRDDIAGRLASGQWWVGINHASSLSFARWGNWTSGSAWQHVRAGDANGDGRDDLFGQDAEGRWWVAESTGELFQSSTRGSWGNSLDWTDVLLADIDADGDDDMLARNTANAWWLATNDSTGFNGRALAQWSTEVTWRGAEFGLRAV